MTDDKHEQSRRRADSPSLDLSSDHAAPVASTARTTTTTPSLLTWRPLFAGLAAFGVILAVICALNGRLLMGFAVVFTVGATIAAMYLLIRIVQHFRIRFEQSDQ